MSEIGKKLLKKNEEWTIPDLSPSESKQGMRMSNRTDKRAERCTLESLLEWTPLGHWPYSQNGNSYMTKWVLWSVWTQQLISGTRPTTVHVENKSWGDSCPHAITTSLKRLSSSVPSPVGKSVAYHWASKVRFREYVTMTPFFWPVLSTTQNCG